MPTKVPFTQRMIEAASKGYKAFTGGLWGGPGEPLPPQTENKEPIRAPYLPGMNMSLITKQSEQTQGTTLSAYAKEGVSFEMLRILADVHELVRSVIDLCKDQMSTQGIKFKLKINENETPKEYQDRTKSSPELKKLKEFFRSPDGEHTFKTWIRLALEEVLVTDALAILKLVDKKTNEIIGLDIIDGATIQPLIDKFGRRPKPPYPAYQQIIDGMVIAEFTSDQLLYFPRNPRVHKLYGQSPVEQIITYVNIGLRRLAFQLGHYTESNIPVGFKDVPESWTPEQIEKFQFNWDAIFAGDVVTRSRMIFVPGGGKDPVFPKKDVLSDEFDEWLARIICHCFSVSPNAFIKNLNRAVAGQQREQADEEGMFSRKAFLKDVLDYIIQVWFGFSEVEAAWIADRAQDSAKQAETDIQYVKHAIKSVDEVRIELGLHPIGVGHGLILNSGMVFLTKESEDMVDQLTTTTQIILTNNPGDGSATGAAPQPPTPEQKAKITGKGNGKVKTTQGATNAGTA